MLKKGIGIFLAVLLLSGLFPAMLTAAAEIEHVTNGGFSEFVTDTGKAVEWGHTGTIGETIVYPEEGDYAGMLELRNVAYVTQSIETVMAGEEYTFSGSLCIVAGGEQPEKSCGKVKISYINASGKEVAKALTKTFYTENSETVFRTQVSFTFTPPEGTERLGLYVRSDTYGTVYWDNISIQGALKPIINEMDEWRPMIEGGKELLTDGGFEEVTEKGKLKHWSGVTTTETYSVTVVEGTPADGTVYGGTHAVRIRATANNPLIAQRITNPEAGATYQTSMWYKIDSMYADPGFKIEWIQTDEFGVDHYINGAWMQKPPVATKTDGWVQYCYHFTVPENCTYLSYMIRLYTGDVEYDVTFDEASLYIIEKAPVVPAKLSTDEVFYYSDMTHGTASVRLNTEDFPEIAKTELALKSETETLWSTEVQRAEGESFTRKFPLSDMIEKADYTLEVTARDAEENTLGEVIKQKVHRYPRPSNMREDGTMLVDGEPFYPVFVYHMNKTDLAYAAGLGINVSQARGDLAGIKEYLDAAYAKGIMCLVPLYNDMKPAGHPDNVESTTQIINELKDHPGVLAWMVMDEATSHWPDRWDLFYASYKLIRDLDPEHAVYILQNTSAQFAELAKYTDILAYDPYPSTRSVLTQHVAKNTNVAAEGVDFEKPVWSLNKAYAAENISGNSRPLPTIMEERHMWYQALMAGASVVGYYSYSDCITTDPPTPMHALDPAKYDLYTGLMTFAEEEQKESYAFFLEHKYPVFREGREENAWYTSYVKNNRVYAIILNRFEEERTVTIPLRSDGGSVTIGGFTAERIYGGEETIHGSGSLTVTLEASGAYVYEITPSENTDFSGLKTTQFHDLAEAAWAGEAIREMENAGFITGTSPSSFRPCEKVTHGTLAAWLQNAFGVTLEAENGEGELTRREMLELCAQALSKYGAAPSVMAEITAALDAEEQAGNIASADAVTRAEAAFTVWLAWSKRDNAGTGFGVYDGETMLWKYTPGTYMIRCPADVTAASIWAALYHKTGAVTELAGFPDIQETEGGWQVTLPAGDYVLKVFLWDAELQPLKEKIRI